MQFKQAVLHTAKRTKSTQQTTRLSMAMSIPHWKEHEYSQSLVSKYYKLLGNSYKQRKGLNRHPKKIRSKQMLSGFSCFSFDHVPALWFDDCFSVTHTSTGTFSTPQARVGLKLHALSLDHDLGFYHGGFTQQVYVNCMSAWVSNLLALTSKPRLKKYLYWAILCFTEVQGQLRREQTDENKLSSIIMIACIWQGTATETRLWVKWCRGQKKKKKKEHKETGGREK